ncbi:flagellar protein FliT [Brevibacillus borstelensis]|uniref:flagellar protein FliT n=1 Tax=Brevibacillus borstelensis TaxID=45462 RepID=UPI00203FF782|nr:flagellar protein FliT [Brevibacillus borstelensis]MCM3590183.1 flagellar protein FliT [Brevibacillus borstelensis]
METKYEAVLKELLQLTIELEQTVMREDSEPDEWLLLLDEREKWINEMGKFETKAPSLSEHRVLLSQIQEINQRLMPVMANRKQALQKKLTEIQKSKTAMNTYYETGPNAFGAFFDSKR